MRTATWAGIIGGVVVLGGGAVIAWDRGWLQGIGLPGPSRNKPGATVRGGIAVTIGPNVTSPQDTYVTGPSAGPSGEYTYPNLWAVAPSTLPVNGYLGGPKITRPNGNVWLVVATNLSVAGSYKGSAPSVVAPWNGIAEYADGQLVRVYPQPASAFGGALAQLGQWSGGGAG